MLYQCKICDYIYDEDGIDPNTGEKNMKWEELPEDWTCPKCNAAKSEFKIMKEEDDLLEHDFDETSFDDSEEEIDDFNEEEGY